MKLLIIGNSHVAAIINAVKELDLSNNTNIDFISRSMGKGGVIGINIADGMINRLELDKKEFKSFCTDSKAQKGSLTLEEYDSVVVVGTEPSLFDYREFSERMLQDLSEDLCNSSTNQFTVLISKIRKNYSKRICLLEKPISTRNSRKMSQNCYNESLNYFNSKYLAQFNVEIVAQPTESFIKNVAVTAPEFQAQPDDHTHMNAGFGMLQILKLKEKLE
ncbi:hypothetical protein C7Y69_03275 [Alteromonas sp. KS69]|uniref:hypothetical protein n=1 Tax=Alteromonas sp. KS69 TaxID=2109917 RepID=UPI000F896634|nr:hypothetical protein [Alteromonas sp. KS69]RUP83087.1 hypothetical protein C7Y69_03275 [Alteromonas sp. KS69]|tara:strand:+ start:3530 stop:4186 length:657 start_codon:yes stop_codon:yes gene_type:complete